MGDLARINTNITALRASFTLNRINSDILLHSERISSGKLINRASDSPSSYFISRQLEKEVVLLHSGRANMERAINFLQTADSKMSMSADIIQELIDLASQAKSDAVSSAEKQAISMEMKELATELNIILTSGVAAQIRNSVANPVNLGAIDNISISGAYSTSDLTINYADGDLIVTGTIAQANDTINRLTTALNNVVLVEEQLGAVVNRLAFRLSNSEQEQISTEANLSTIRDADLIEEQVELSKLMILQQTAVSSVAQANAAPRSLLVLLPGGSY
ncbi:flagellin [candidate division KSB1 bacterium]